MANILFVTGADTGSGKTLLTALLLVHLRAQGKDALAMKPFCTGGRRDVRILRRSQDQELTADMINPFYFETPAAPLVASRRAGRTVALPEVVGRIEEIAHQCEWLLVEGAGGLLVPLGPNFTVADLIKALGCPVVLVARNKLGAVNHTLLSLACLRTLGTLLARVVLMNSARPDVASDTNAQLIHEFAPQEVLGIPYLGRNPTAPRALIGHANRLKKVLAEIVRFDTLATALSKGAESRRARHKRK